MSRDCRGDSNQPKFSSGTPHFFKIILEDTLQENKLRIPKNFLNKCGETLTASVSVKLPCGSIWNMELRKYEDKFWLDQGWPEFAEHYSIGRGHMLIFRYDGNSEFHVVIFDTSTVEIDYPSIHFDESNIDEKLQGPKREIIDDDFVENLDDFSPCHQTGVNSSSPCSRRSKRLKTSPTGKTQSNLSCSRAKDSHRNETAVENSMNEVNSENSKPDMKGKSGSPARSDRQKSTTKRKRKLEIVRDMRTVDKRDRLAALQRTTGFNSELPFFKVFMQPCYVFGEFLCFQCHFANMYLKNRSSDVILSVPNGKKSCPMKYTFGMHKKTTPRFRGGWRAFAQDNNLKVGDVCVFILLDEIKVSFEVVIFRGRGSSKAPMSSAQDETGTPSLCKSFTAEQANRCKSRPWKKSHNALTYDEKVRILEKTPFESEKPFFRVVIQPSYKWHVHVPLDLVERHIKNEGDVVLSIPNGRSWSAQLRKRSKNTVKFAAVICRGWKEFLADNGLKVGDVCNFELLNGTKISLQVSIFRVADGYKCQGSQAGDFAKGADKPKKDEKCKKQEPSQELKMKEIEDNESAEIFDKFPPFSHPQKKMKTSIAKMHNSFCKRGTSSSSKLPAYKATTSLVKEAKVTRSYRSDNPYFMLTMKPSYIHTNSNLKIPAKFARTYINEKQCDVKLWISDGSSWSVQYKARPMQDKFLVFEFRCGWKTFKQENVLEVGDVCVFELIKGNEISFKVSIFRVSDGAEDYLSLSEKKMFTSKQ